MAGRSQAKADASLVRLAEVHPTSTGHISFLHLDLNDLSTIRASADALRARTDRLDVLVHNAGVMFPPKGSATAQGFELQLGTNCLAPFLLNHFLHPLLAATAKSPASASAPPRVVWVSSSASEMPPKGAIHFEGDGPNYGLKGGPMTLYCQSKAGNVLHAVEYAERARADGIISVALNPGNLHSDLQRHLKNPVERFMVGLMCHPTIFGAYTEIFAATSPEVTIEKTGAYIIPWGRFGVMGSEVTKAIKDPKEGGNGNMRRFWDWSTEQVKPYM